VAVEPPPPDDQPFHQHCCQSQQSLCRCSRPERWHPQQLQAMSEDENVHSVENDLELMKCCRLGPSKKRAGNLANY